MLQDVFRWSEQGNLHVKTNVCLGSWILFFFPWWWWDFAVCCEKDKISDKEVNTTWLCEHACAVCILFNLILLQIRPFVQHHHRQKRISGFHLDNIMSTILLVQAFFNHCLRIIGGCWIVFVEFFRHLIKVFQRKPFHEMLFIGHFRYLIGGCSRNFSIAWDYIIDKSTI